MAPDKVKSEDAMTFGELLALIADQKRRLNVAPLRGEHGSAAASTVFKIQPHLNAGAV